MTLAVLVVLPRLVPFRGSLHGKAAPAFSLEVAANGDAHTRASLDSLRGHAVVLDFWASWCGPCALEAPVVDRVAQRFAKNGVVVMGINSSDSPAVMRAYAAAKQLTYPMLIDADGQTSQSYGVDKLPSLVVIDKTGKVHAFVSGLIDESGLSELITEAMN